MSQQATTGATVDRFDVRSADGTSIAVWVEGTGPALVLVHGSIADHTTFDPFVAVIREHVTTYAMDRRGFGASGEGPGGYALERDVEDVAAVVAEVAARTGGPVTLWGHSYGAGCAMGGAAAAGRAVGHLVVYEPCLGVRYPAGAIERIERLLRAGDREGAIVTLLVDILELSGEEVAAFRADRLWPVRVAAAHTVPRECRVEDGWAYRPGQFAGVTAPTLFLVGSESVPAFASATAAAAAALPGSRVEVLDGHGHFGHKADPDLVTGIIRRFVSA